MLLKACPESNIKSNLYVDQVDFKTAQNWGATTLLNAYLHYSQKGDKIRYDQPIRVQFYQS